MTEPLRVVAVVSFRHSGSTLLGSILGGAPGATYVGETDRALYRRRSGPLRCRCQRTVTECEHWAVDEAVLDGWPARRGRDTRWFGLRHHLHRVLRGRSHEAVVQRDLWLAASAARGRVLVDSSKDLRLLRRQLRDPSWRIDVVHLVRDAGPAVASSLRRGDETTLHGAGAIRRTVAGLAEVARWTTSSLLVGPMLGGRAASIRRIRFEDLGESPATVVSALAADLDLEPPIFHERTVATDEPHIIRANRGARGGAVEVSRADTSVAGLPRPVAALCRLADRAASRRTAASPTSIDHSGRTGDALRGDDARVGSHT